MKSQQAAINNTDQHKNDGLTKSFEKVELKKKE